MSGVLKIKVEPVVTGPLGDGEAARVAAEWATLVTDALGKEAVARLGAVVMNKSGRATGAFKDELRVMRTSPAEVRIPGPMISGVTWAPWLEGTSRRNATSSFKGYHLFRKTQRELQAQAPVIGQRVLDGMLPAIGGVLWPSTRPR